MIVCQVVGEAPVLLSTCIFRYQHITIGINCWGRDEIDAILQTTFSNAFLWMKMYEFRLGFHWHLFLWFELKIFQHWFRQWLGADQATSHYLNQWWVVCWRIYALLGINELNKCMPISTVRLMQDFHNYFPLKQITLSTGQRTMIVLSCWPNWTQIYLYYL